MTPYYQDKWVTIYHGDCREILPYLSEVDLIITDPPWFISKEITICRSTNARYKYKGKDISLNFGSWDLFQDEDEYFQFTDGWIKRAAKCLKGRGHFVCFFDENRSSYLIEIAKRYGLISRQHLYWIKTNPTPRARKVNFMVAVEHACWFTKNCITGATFNYELGQQANYVMAPIPGRTTTRDDGVRVHPTQKPYKVLATWIKYLSCPNDLILDPFLGSGSTCYAAKKLNRRAIGIEVDERYCEVAVRRCAQAVLELENLTGGDQSD